MCAKHFHQETTKKTKVVLSLLKSILFYKFRDSNWEFIIVIISLKLSTPLLAGSSRSSCPRWKAWFTSPRFITTWQRGRCWWRSGSKVKNLPRHQKKLSTNSRLSASSAFCVNFWKQVSNQSILTFLQRRHAWCPESSASHFPPRWNENLGYRFDNIINDTRGHGKLRLSW